jgi:hypothetical protein
MIGDDHPYSSPIIPAHPRSSPITHTHAHTRTHTHTHAHAPSHTHHSHPSALIPDLTRSSPLIPDHPRSSFLTPDHPFSPPIILSHPRSSLLSMDHHQALVAAIYFSQQAEQRAKALPRLLPASTHLFWEPGQSERRRRLERAAGLGASPAACPALPRQPAQARRPARKMPAMRARWQPCGAMCEPPASAPPASAARPAARILCISRRCLAARCLLLERCPVWRGCHLPGRARYQARGRLRLRRPREQRALAHQHALPGPPLDGPRRPPRLAMLQVCCSAATALALPLAAAAPPRKTAAVEQGVCRCGGCPASHCTLLTARARCGHGASTHVRRVAHRGPPAATRAACGPTRIMPSTWRSSCCAAGAFTTSRQCPSLRFPLLVPAPLLLAQGRAGTRTGKGVGVVRQRASEWLCCLEAGVLRPAALLARPDGALEPAVRREWRERRRRIGARLACACCCSCCKPRAGGQKDQFRRDPHSRRHGRAFVRGTAGGAGHEAVGARA